MRIENEYDREERRAQAGVAAGVVLGLLAIAFALLVRYRPEVARALVPLDTATVTAAVGQAPPEESAVLERSTGGGVAPPASEARAIPDSAPDSRHLADTLPATLALLQDTGSRARSPGRRAVITDLVLLPCSTANPRPDGSIVIPPHNPRHRTIVGLPQKAGDPPRGFVVPPHDPDRENQIPIRIIRIDSILAHTLRVPPHDPSSFNVVRPDSMSCLPDSAAAQSPPP